ncbi:MAG: 30S ribosomal protein S8 [Chlamydiae bacterium]|nr:30S ribosomal protein S8 [Chlamydiota bacterium]
MTDPIADLLTRIRNSSAAQKRYVNIPYSKIKEDIVKVLLAKGFVVSYKITELEGHKNIQVFLKYTQDRSPVLQQIQRKSRPGLRKYVRKDQIPRILGGMGISIVSTSQGVIEGEEAKRKKLGGELLCVAW